MPAFDIQPQLSEPTATKKFGRWMEDHGWFWVGGAGLVIGSFVVLGIIIDNSSGQKPGWWGSFTDYSHEIASAIVGSILTLLFTALLLRAQEHSTATLQEAQAKAESQRANNAAFFAEKMAIYGVLLNGLETFLQNDYLEDKEFTALTLTCLHVSYIADADVLDKLECFTAALLQIVRDDSEEIDGSEEHDEGRDPITHAERKTILSKFGEVATSIKSDLDRSRIILADDSSVVTHEHYEKQKAAKEEKRLDKIQNIIDDLSLCSIAYLEADRRLAKRHAEIAQNAARAAQPIMNAESFLKACSSPDETLFFRQLIAQLQANEYQLLWTRHGFSLERTIKFFPGSTADSSHKNVINRPAQRKRAQAVEATLKNVLPNVAEEERTFCNQSIKFSWQQMQPEVADWIAVIEKVLKTAAHD